MHSGSIVSEGPPGVDMIGNISLEFKVIGLTCFSIGAAEGYDMCALVECMF